MRQGFSKFWINGGKSSSGGIGALETFMEDQTVCMMGIQLLTPRSCVCCLLHNVKNTQIYTMFKKSRVMIQSSLVRLPSRRTTARKSLPLNMARLIPTMLLMLVETSGQEAQVTSVLYWVRNIQILFPFFFLL